MFQVLVSLVSYFVDKAELSWYTFEHLEFHIKTQQRVSFSSSHIICIRGLYIIEHVRILKCIYSNLDNL